MARKTVHPGLRRYVEREILPRYRAFDRAHDVRHARRVIDESLRLAAIYDIDPDPVFTAAAYHDTGLVQGRERHHLASGEIVRADLRLREWLTEEEILTAAEAAEDHRASSDRPPRSLCGRIVAEADRMIDPEVTLRRTVQYGLEHYPHLTVEEHYARFRTHLLEKYARGGYLKLWIPESDNAARLETLRCAIADEALLRSRFDALFSAECAALSTERHALR